MLVGALGLVWIIAWLASIRRSDFVIVQSQTATQQGTSEWWCEVARDRRFWALVVMVIAINIIWHITRAWLTKFLQQGRAYSEADALLISSAFYIATDVGCLLSGAATLWLTRRQLDAHRARLWVFGACSVITGLTSVVALLPKGWPLLAVLFVVGAAALGLFPCYYSFTQELGARHVGKATGLLSAIGWLVASPLQKYFGRLVDHTHSFDLGISLIGWVPCLAFLTMLLFWRRESSHQAL
jgi:ACS family hexuronate transporter-like MFS transporter